MKISLSDISKSFGGRDIFSHFSLDIESGMRLCICGQNGVGKSTLLRIIAGIEAPDSGKVVIPAGCRIGYVEQELSEEELQKPLLSFVMDVVHDWSEFWVEWEEASQKNDQAQLMRLMHKQAELEARFGYNPENRAKTVLSGLGFSDKKLFQTLGQLSGGWREKAKLARVLTAGADLLLLDEPTNHLDLDAVEWLEDFVKSFQGALVFVAHDKVFMENIGSHILYLGLNKPVFMKTTYSQFLRLQEAYEEQRAREYKALQEDINKKMAFVDRFRYKATKARQAGSRLKQVKKLEKELEGHRPTPKQKELRFSWPEVPTTEKVILRASNLAFGFKDEPFMWKPLEFTIFNGQRIALVGHNGCGKSTLLKILTSRLAPSTGTIHTASTLRLGYYAQHQMELLRPEKTVIEQMRLIADPKTNEEELMSVLGLFLLGQDFFDRKIESLSGGEKSRFVLATLFLKQCNFLILDEPTNHLDLESREALAQALNLFKGTLLVVAHDRWLLQAIGCEIWMLDPQGIHHFDTFADYDNQRHAEVLASKEPSAKAAVKKEESAQLGALPKQSLNREQAKNLKREQAMQRNALHKKLKPLKDSYAQLESELDAVMSKESSIESTLASPEAYQDEKQYSAMISEYEQLKKRSEEIILEMDDLETRIKAIQDEQTKG